MSSPRGKQPSINNKNSKKNNYHTVYDHQLDNSYASSSYTLREKQKQQHQPASNGNFTSKFDKNPTSTTTTFSNLQNPLATTSRSNMRANLLGNSDDTTTVEEHSNLREENYQRLSSSINDLFTNLLKELEKQKNKEYLMNNTDDMLNNSKLNNFLMMSSSNGSNHNINSKVADHLQETREEEEDDAAADEEIEKANANQISNRLHHKSKTNNNSNDSNKDSGFNQESFYNNMGSPHSSNKNNGHNSIHKDSNSMNHSISNQNGNHAAQNHYNKHQANEPGNDKPVETTSNNSPKSSNLSSDHQEMSLLERYLNSEQIIAYKHTQIEVLLHKWFVKQNSFLMDDDYYSIIEYILNQEGISLKTFVKLIKEKFNAIEWHDELLVELFDIVNYDEVSKSSNDAIAVKEDKFHYLNDEIPPKKVSFLFNCPFILSKKIP
jgi:hypothetical protein